MQVQIEQGGGGNGTKERVADIYDDAVYALQAWERDFDRESAVRICHKPYTTIPSSVNEHDSVTAIHLVFAFWVCTRWMKFCIMCLGWI